MKHALLSLLLLISLALATICSAEAGDTEPSRFPHHSVRVQIDVANSNVAGVVTVSDPTGAGLTIMKGSLRILSVTFGGRPAAIEESPASFALKATGSDPVVIRFEGTLRSSESPREPGINGSVIGEEGIFLSGIWFPRAKGLFTYDLTVSLPPGYRPVSEADEIMMTEHGTSVDFDFTFPHPAEEVTVVATNRYELSVEQHGDTRLVAYFPPEKQDLASSCIAYARKYLGLYEEIFGPFPFKRLAVVESFLTAGSSSATMTMLGKDIERLPLSAETSIGRGVARQWFGSMVYVDRREGNWAEGLAVHLGDRLRDDQKGKGWDSRKQVLIDFESRVSGSNDIPLKAFTREVDGASRAIGLGKSAMVFHMLRRLVGDGNFSASLKNLVARFGFRQASWQDLQDLFEQASGKDLAWFFDQWVREPGIADLSIENVRMKWNGSAYETRFDLAQHGKARRLSVPITFFSSTGQIDRIVEIDGKKKDFEILTGDLPERMVVDGGYDLFRRLSTDEYPPVLSRLLSADTLVSVPPPSGDDRYAALREVFAQALPVQSAEITLKDLESSSYLLFGADNTLLKRLFGRVPADSGFTMEVRKNPSHPGNVIGIVTASSADEVEAAAQEITRYDRYSRVSFERGRITVTETAPSARGIEKDLAGQTTAIDVPQVKTLSHVIDSVRDKRVVYIGEAHDRFAHHAAQLELIKALHRSNRRIAIGMEMFQRPSQQALDDFLASRTDEREFIVSSEYFKRWGFDYHLYKPIVDYARQERIPVIALNLRREITEKVTKSGIDALTEEEKKELPKEMDFSDQAYRDRLYEIFKSHPSSREGNFDYFVQNQLLWDETMAESVDDFLKGHPDYQMVVLAGNGHIAYGSGIPKRVFRRNGLSYATVMNDGDMEQGIADHLISPKAVDAVSSPKLMVLLDEKTGKLTVTGFPEHSVSEKAGMKKGDVLVSFDGKDIPKLQDLRYELYFRKKGDSVTVKVRRQELDEAETVKELKVTL